MTELKHNDFIKFIAANFKVRKKLYAACYVKKG